MGNTNSIASRVVPGVLSAGVSYLAYLAWKKATSNFKPEEKVVTGIITMGCSVLIPLVVTDAYGSSVGSLGSSFLGLFIGYALGILQGDKSILLKSNAFESDGSIKQKDIMNIMPNYLAAGCLIGLTAHTLYYSDLFVKSCCT